MPSSDHYLRILRELIKPSDPALRVASYDQLALRGYEEVSFRTMDFMVKNINDKVEIYYHVSPNGDYVYRGIWNLRG